MTRIAQAAAGGYPGRVEAWLERERDQLPLWAPVTLGSGIIAWFSLPSRADWMGWLCLCLAFATAGLLLPRGMRLRRMILAAGLLGAAGCALVWARAELLAHPVLARPVFTRLAATVEDVEPLPAQALTRVTLRPLGRPDLPERVRVNISDDDVPPGLASGARIDLRGRLMPPPPAALPGGYDFAERAWFAGIGATGRAVRPVRITAPASGGGEPSLRHRLSAHILTRLSGGAGGIAATLATGDRGGISESDAEAMRRSGLAHLLSISGLHVSALIGAVMFLVFRLLALSPRLALRWPLLPIAAGAGALAGIGYTLLTGAEVPTIRSCVAALLVLAAMALGREALTLRLIASGALFVMLCWPEAVVGPSFQLSFAAVTAIVALHEHKGFRALTARRDEGRPARLLRGALSLFLTGMVVEAALAPIALYHFHQTGLLGAFANIIAIPLTTFVIMPVEAAALLFDMAGLGAPFWWLAGKALDLLLGLAHFVATRPGAVAMLPAFAPWAFALSALGMLWLFLWRGRARWQGLVPLALGMIVMIATPPPDILVTGDGRHMAVRAADGGFALLRNRTGDYVRDMLSESAGFDGAMTALEDLPQARCSPDICAVNMAAAGRSWRIVATRSGYLVPRAALAAACGAADIAVSDRRLPRSCIPRWLKLDRAFLARHGGVAIVLRTTSVRTALAPGDAHPWVRHSTPRRSGRAIGHKPDKPSGPFAQPRR